MIQIRGKRRPWSLRTLWLMETGICFPLSCVSLDPSSRASFLWVVNMSWYLFGLEGEGEKAGVRSRLLPEETFCQLGVGHMVLAHLDEWICFLLASGSMETCCDTEVSLLLIAMTCKSGDYQDVCFSVLLAPVVASPTSAPSGNIVPASHPRAIGDQCSSHIYKSRAPCP